MKKYLSEYKNNIVNIKKYYAYLIELTKNHQYIGITNEWLVDNYYKLVEQEKNIKLFLSSRKQYNYAFKNVDLYKIIEKTLKQYNYKLDLKVLINVLNTYQDNHNCYFTYSTVSTILNITYIVIINELCKLCNREENRIVEQEKASKLLSTLDKNNVNKLLSYIDFDNSLIKRPIYLEKIYNGLKEHGLLSPEILEELDTLLDNNNINLNKIFESVYKDSAKDSVIISNIFYTIETIMKSKIEKMYTSICKTEKVLEMDECYDRMTIESKELYRRQIHINALKKHQAEYDYAKDILSQSLQEKKHIGFYLFSEPKLKLRRVTYLVYIFLMTIIISIFVSKYLFKPFWLSTILLIIPTSEIVIQLTNKLLLKIFKPKPLPKLDYSDGIPKSASTMVVIATIIKSKEKVFNMFETLEKYYLANQSENLYFTLLGDCSSNNKADAPYDNEIIQAFDFCSSKLNKKYGKIFNYAYRKRTYNKSEGCYLGWERKRGALQNLNELLLNKLTYEQKEKLFQKTSLDNFKTKIRYIITLDVDTKLVLKTALNLVGAMEHPLNRPILNEKQNQVIGGYGIMQPKISVDIECSNKTPYTQVYAGIGGFDVYNSVIPNFYQDVFCEGSFIGKGIYDLEIFDKVLSNRFPCNLVLSHDLLEGNYIRCGFLSDIELIDDFPPSFLIDSTRKHRWARGDMQIMSWLFKKPLNSIEKFKIFDNFRRGLLDVSLLVLIITVYVNKTINPYFWILYICFTILLPIIYYVIDNLKIQKEMSTRTKQYENIVIGIRSLLIRAISSFSSIPYNSKMYTDAFIRAIYRMKISKNNLLNWLTAEEAEKTAKNDLKTYILQFKFNYFIGIILIALTFVFNKTHIISSIIVSLIFILSPLIFYLMGKNYKKHDKLLSKKETKDIENLAKKTWKYFEKFLTKENNYLIPDNYQLNREIKQDYKTSPTDISFSFIAVISAYELGLISIEKSIDLIEKITNSVESLKKWNGHLYNWYNIKTKDILYPYHVSTVDSGNFVASLITTAGFLEKHNVIDLKARITKIVNDTDFSKLYKFDQNVFSCGYDSINEELTCYNYNKFASEARLTSFLAIIKGDVLPKHWFSLDKTLTKFHGYKGLLSWSGTSFEYYMPLIYMKDYPNTLVDESYYFSYYCQKEYMKEIDTNLPWGISEAAYNVLDDSKNYKYKAFGTPYLHFHDRPDERIVISPYASVLVFPKKPREVYENYLKYKNIGMEGDFGLYESYDVEDKKQIYSYYAHHQGMIIASLLNYLKNNIIQNYFYQDIRVKAFDILNKEKIQIKPMIDSKINKYKKYTYEKENIPNDIRNYNYLKERPEVSILSNSRYTVLINDYGNGFSRYKNIQLNRYRKISENDYGMYLYIKDLSTGKIWSNTYAPTRVKPERYEVTFALDEIKFIRHDNDFVTKTEIIVSKEYNAEIRRITIKNISEKTKDIELTSYFEPIVSENTDDISHRVFNSFTLKSSFDEETKSIIFERKLKNVSDKHYTVHKLFISNIGDNYTYETERANFLNRNDEYSLPSGLFKKLTNYVGDNIDPIASMRNIVSIESKSEITCYIINGFGKSREQVLNIINSYNNDLAIDDAFNLSSIMTNKNIKHQGLIIDEVNLYNKALNYLYQTSKIHLSNERKEYLINNSLGQRDIWKFGVSGDIPIVLIEINDITGLGIVREVLKMFQYYKTNGIYVDVVMINSENIEYSKIIANSITEELRCMYSTNNFSTTPGSVTIIEKINISEKEMNLFRSIARLKFDAYKSSSLNECIENLQIDNKKIDYKNAAELISEKIEIKEEIEFDNTYGGFIKDGKEYLIKNPNTPLPWTNVLCNNNFGTVITNNDNGFTYAYNCSEFKLTSWTNDVILNDKSEYFKINNKIINWNTCNHGFGYSTFKFQNSNYRIEATYFIPVDLNVKISIMNIYNLDSNDFEFDLDYCINPVLGTTEEKTTRHIVDEFDKKNNALILENKYMNFYKGKQVYLSSNEKINKVISEAILKGISVNVNLKKNETKTIIFMFGCVDSGEKLSNTIKSLTIENVKREYKNTLKYWDESLSTIKIKTPDKSFDYMMNGWLLYQTLASRIMARTGFYQVGGAFGFRDQLQDCTNICMIRPDMTRNQILNCARHQFSEGDVLHWWHSQNRFGLRTRFKDDYLWLIYATSEYLKITNDFKILDEKIPFVVGPLLNPKDEEKGMEYSYTEEKYSLLEHLKLVVDKAVNELGKNGLPLIGGGDWNDGMNHIGIKGKGTSIWLGFFMYDIINRFISIVNDIKADIPIDKYKKFNEQLKLNLMEKGWDGKYYLRAINDDNIKIGGMGSKECKIDLISQSFAILTDIATKEQIDSIVDSVEKQLVDTKNGLIKLLTPAFTNDWIDPGYIKNYPSGIRENGGQYTHACSWYIMALDHINKSEKAYEYFSMINPINHSKTQLETEKYKVEPYVICADIYTNKNFIGRGGWTWYTGSSGWFYKIGIETIIGIKKIGDELIINTNIPLKWDKVEVTYRYLDTKYNITIVNDSIDEIILDGKIIKDKIQLENDLIDHEVIVKRCVSDKI